MRRAMCLTYAAFALMFISPGEVQAQFTRETLRWINENPKIREIVIEGESYFTDSQIRNQLFSKEWGWLRDGVFKDRRESILQRETILRDTAQIKGMYLKVGFLQVSVTESWEKLPDSNARVVITINEGKQYFYGSRTLSGDIPEVVRNGIREPFDRLKRGKPLNPFDVRASQLDLKELFANHGYPYAAVSYAIDTTLDSSMTRIDFNVSPGLPVVIGKIRVKGDGRYGDGAVRRELDIKEGKMYRRRDIQESQRHLLRSGYFSNAQLRVLDSAEVGAEYDRLRPQFEVGVRENEAHFFNARAGVLSDSLRDIVGELQLTVGKRNFLRTRRLELQANGLFAFEGQKLLNHRYSLRFVEPWFLGIRMPLSLSGEFEPGVRSVLQPYRVRKWRLNAQSLWEIGRRLRVVGGAQWESVKIFDINEAELESFREREGITVRRKLFLSILRDTRDDIFVPHTGTVTDVKADYFGDFLGGDANFFKLEASWSKYQPFIGSIIRATRIKSGLAEPLGAADNVPLIDRFYVGGANGIRGFSLDELPQPLAADGSFSPGAEFYIIFNQEMRFPLVGKLWGSVFFDAGNGWEGLDDPRISFDGAAYSVGAGVQYLSPAGPLRLDYARRLQTKGIENVARRNYRFHFTILYAF